MITRLSVAAATLVLLLACGGADSSPERTTSKEPTAPTAGSSGSSGASTSGSSGTPTSNTPMEDPKPLPKTDPSSTACKLPELKAADVSPAFTVYDPPTTQPPAAKGGALDGKYTIDKATVYLPTSTKSVVKPAQSTGTVNGWAIFSGKDYRINLKADLQVQSLIGPQPQKVDVADQGTFSSTGSAIKLETSCAGAAAPAAEITFSENGARGTLVIKQTTSHGDTYLVVEAARAAN